MKTNAEIEETDTTVERDAVLRFIRMRAAMADGLVRFGGPELGDKLRGLADEIDSGLHTRKEDW